MHIDNNNICNRRPQKLQKTHKKISKMHLFLFLSGAARLLALGFGWLSYKTVFTWNKGDYDSNAFDALHSVQCIVTRVQLFAIHFGFRFESFLFFVLHFFVMLLSLCTLRRMHETQKKKTLALMVVRRLRQIVNEEQNTIEHFKLQNSVCISFFFPSVFFTRTIKYQLYSSKNKLKKTKLYHWCWKL